MIVVKLQGGLGNQLFQYAIGRALSERRSCPFYFDHRFLEDRTPTPGLVFRQYDLDVFGLPERRVSSSALHLFFEKWPWWKARGVQLGLLRPHAVVRERHFHYDDQLRLTKGHLYLDGYWQSPKYFENIQEELRKELRFADPVPPASTDLLNQIRECNSVCVNVRRGDFLSNSFHGVCSAGYFEKAMSLVKERVADPFFFVFSDDIEWCNTQFGNAENVLVVDHQHKGKKFASYLQLMASCRHFIIPNSSFAWWAVWLANRKDNIVIAPQTLFSDPGWDTKDLIPDHWIRLPNN